MHVSIQQMHQIHVMDMVCVQHANLANNRFWCLESKMQSASDVQKQYHFWPMV